MPKWSCSTEWKDLDAVLILPKPVYSGELNCPPGYTKNFPINLSVKTKAKQVMLYIPEALRFSFPK